MKKKFFMILFLVLLVGFTGCNSSSSTESKNVSEISLGDKYNYSVTVNGVTIDDWKVFYKDNDGIYIITSKYLPIEAIGTKDDAGSIRSKARLRVMGEKYGMYFSTDSLSYQEPNQDVIDKYFKLLKLDSTDGSNKVVSKMLHSENWEGLVNKDMGAEYALGGVPIEMFVASWNEKYPDSKIYLSTKEYGYGIGNSENPTTYELDLKNTKGYNDKLYFPTQDIIEEGNYANSIDYKIKGYQLAAPSWCEDPTYDKCGLIEVVNETSATANIDGFYTGSYGYALRPIVFIRKK